MAIAFILIDTAKLNGVDPQAWRVGVLSRIADPKTKRQDEQMLWTHTALLLIASA